MVMTTTSISEVFVSPIAELETTERGVRPHRLPSWVRDQFPDPQLLAMETQPSGVKLAFRSPATRIELVAHTSRVSYAGADRPRGRIDLVVDGTLLRSDVLTGGDQIHVDLLAGTTELRSGPTQVIAFDDLETGDKKIEIWLPHNEALELISLATDAPITPVQRSGPVWVHHGSSISHGSNAESPSGIWPVIAARSTGLELRNLGLGGSALLDPFMARVIRDAPADVISVKMGINIVNLDSMRLRTLIPALHGFLDTIRDGHPTTPILLASPIFCGIHENTPGPGSIDPGTIGTDQVRFIATGDDGDTGLGRLTLQVIRGAMEAVVVGRRDPQLHYIDGLDLYGTADALTHPLPDGLHPDADTHSLIGERFAERLADLKISTTDTGSITREENSWQST
jgi:hypothetical protein